MTRSRREIIRIRAHVGPLPSKKHLDKPISRPDDPAGVMQHANRYEGGKALIILGGYSSENWINLLDLIKPDVLLGGNGVNAIVDHLDYWMCAENMQLSKKMADKGDPRAKQFMEMFYRDSGAKYKLISHRSWDLVKDRSNCISIQRRGWERGINPADFSMREYGNGFLNGWIFDNKNAIRAATRVGTVGAHLLHLAGILGCKEVHTIGFDLMFRNGSSGHHSYPYPIYMPDRFRTPGMFVTYKGVSTQLLWIETAQFLKQVEPLFEEAGLSWIDHSHGLLSILGLQCAEQI